MKNMNGWTLGLLAGFVLMAAPGAWAAGSASELAAAPLPTAGGYAGFGFGYAPVSGSGLITSGNGLSLGGRIGYAWNPRVSTEVALGGIAGVKSGAADVGINMLSASVLGYLPVRSGVDAYARLGYAVASVGLNTQLNKVSKSKTGMTYGFGVQIGHGEKVSYRLGVDHYDLSAWSAMPISANDLSFSIDFRL